MIFNQKVVDCLVYCDTVRLNNLLVLGKDFLFIFLALFVAFLYHQSVDDLKAYYFAKFSLAFMLAWVLLKAWNAYLLL